MPMVQKKKQASREIKWDIGELKSFGVVTLKTSAKIGNLSSSLSEKNISTYTVVSANETDDYESNLVTIILGRPELSIKQESDRENTYIKEGSTINYKFTIENQGTAALSDVVLREVIPSELNVKDISYVINNEEATKNADSSTQAIVKVEYLAPNDKLEVNVRAIAAGLNGVQEKTVTNLGYVSAKGISEIESNEITHIIEASERNQIDPTTDVSTSKTRSSTLTNIAKTYKITGTAWLDNNKDGVRDSNEEVLAGISAKLVNSETGIIIKTVTTDVYGSYTFAGIENGNYIIIFDYDTVKYAVTTYQKAGVSANMNSDVVSTKVEQDGKVRNAAMTDVIRLSNGSISGIDIGLILADIFDLEISKTITKVTVQTAKDTTTNAYDNSKLVKTEIAAKHLSGATVYVEYEITVTNVGDIPGYAKKVVDYIPSGMTFNSNLEANSSWYTGSDGNLYTDSFANRELTKGQSSTIKLVLTRQMTEDNTDIVNNNAEIYEDYNIYGVSDNNSTPANKAKNENDISSADIAIMVKTGATYLNVSIIMMTLLLMMIVAFVIYGKVQEIIRRREGV